jgi:excisionase family DNA binding protein
VIDPLAPAAPRIPRLSLSYDEAAEALGVSRDHFDRHVLPHVKVAPVGRRRLVLVRDLERFLGDRAV